MSGDLAWPALPLDEWRDTRDTLQLWTQIVGKTRLALAPAQNHWWHIALHVTPRGLTTRPMSHGERTFAVDFDFVDHALGIRASDGTAAGFPLAGRSVAGFYDEYRSALRKLALDVPIHPVPVELEEVIPFPDDHGHASYDADAVHRWFTIIRRTHAVLEQFGTSFLGKSSPVHFFWGSFDLAATRFSGRRAPLHPGGAPNTPDYVMTEAYSHECSSVGFWPGGGALSEPAFYSYAYPEPAGYSSAPVRPREAFYHPDMREFVLPYEAVRRDAAPESMLLDFCRSTYGAAADLGRWDRVALERLPSTP